MREQRFFTSSVSRRDAGGNNSPGVLVGYAALYSSLSENLGNFRERLAPGCFDRCLRTNPDVRALINHDPNYIVGRTKNGTLKLASDAIGLRTECTLPDTSYARDLYTNVANGTISQMSFAFEAEDEDWSEEDDPEDRGKRISVRTIRAAKIQDTSYVVFPAYSQTSVHVSSKAPFFNSLSRAIDQLFPQGIPAEVRSHAGLRDLDTRRSRRDLVNKVLSI